MTTDFRALCVELTDCLEKADWPNRYRHVFRQWVDIARTALADEPAVPEGREPATCTEGVCGDGAALLKDGVMVPIEAVVRELNEGARARAALADEPAVPQPQPPADGEVAELVRLLGSMAAEAELADQVHDASVLDRAADLLQRLSPPQPVPVSERLPGEPISERLPGDQLCWWFESDEEDEAYGSSWTLLRIRGSTSSYTHWLPAHALPLPGQEVSND